MTEALTLPERGERHHSPGIAEQGHPPPDFAHLVGRRGWARLHPDIRRRFAPGHARTPVTYAGQMLIDRSGAGFVFAALAGLLGGPLPIRTGRDVPAAVTVRADGQGGVVWERTLRLRPNGSVTCVRSTKRTDGDGALIECVDGGLGMVLAVFEAAGALVFESRSYFLRLPFLGLLSLGLPVRGPRHGRLPIPAFLTPGRCRVAHSAVSPSLFRFTLEMTHPVFGRTFFQIGLFNDPEA